MFSDPNVLSVLDVVNAVDPIARIERCPLDNPEHLKLCPLHAELDAAISSIETSLRLRTIGELLTSRKRGSTSCNFPRGETLYHL